MSRWTSLWEQMAELQSWRDAVDGRHKREDCDHCFCQPKRSARVVDRAYLLTSDYTCSVCCLCYKETTTPPVSSQRRDDAPVA